MKDEPGLFMIYVGGRADKANIELHDVLFAAGKTIADTHEQLRAKWFGSPESLHLDSYLRIDNVDGYRVRLQPDPPQHREKLFFVNLGGYDPASIAELHEFGLFVETSSGAAKVRAKNTLLHGRQQQHKDDLFAVDDCLVLSSVDRYFVHLQRGGEAQPQVPDWFGYKPIGRRDA